MEHSASLRSAIDTLRKVADSLIPPGVVANDGAYVDVSMDKNSSLESWKQLDPKRRVQLMNVRRRADNSSVELRLFLLAKTLGWTTS